MRRSTKAVNFRATLRLETLEQRNVMSASPGFAMALAGPTIPPTPTSSKSFVVQTGPCGTDAVASAGVQLANSNVIADAITSETPVTTSAAVTSAIVVAGLPALPTSNDNAVVDPPSEVVAMPQSPLPDGVLQRRETPFLPLVLTVNSDFVASPEANASVDTTITEFGCLIVIKLKRPPEQPADSPAAPPTLSSTRVTSATNQGSEAPTPLTVIPNPAPVNTLHCEQRASCKLATPPGVVSPSDSRYSTAAELDCRLPCAELVSTVQTTQPVGIKPRRR